MIIGQEKICNRINMSTLDTFPRSLMLVGEEGSGKHLICDYIATHLNLGVKDITDELTLEKIEEIYQSVEPCIYSILINKISVKEENVILKFLEEPLNNSYIILLADAEIGILQTILNRCQIWQLQHYSRDVLVNFLSNGDSRILEVAHTPGAVMKMCEQPFADMFALANKIVDKISNAVLPNTLSLTRHLSFKGEGDKFDANTFVGILLSVITQKWKTSIDKRYYDAYFLTSNLKKDFYVNNVDKKYLFDKYLVELREVMRGVNQ